MKLNNSIFDIEPKYYEENEQKGKVERIDYHTTNWDGAPMDKYAFVYTPYGYDPKKAYKIFYLIHGSGEIAEKYLFQNGEENPLKRAVDNMIAWGDIEPIIIVTPSQYPYNVVYRRDPNAAVQATFVQEFHKELCDDLMPVVESKYHTYTDFKTDAESLKAARDYRAVAGWSMGAMTTWNIFINRIGYFRNFAMMSGNYSAVNGTGDISKEWADATAELVVEKVKEQGFGKKDFNVYGICGTLDSLYERYTLYMGCLQAYPEIFDFFGEDQNTTYVVWPKGEHHTQWRLQYTINVTQQYFGK